MSAANLLNEFMSRDEAGREGEWEQERDSESKRGREAPHAN